MAKKRDAMTWCSNCKRKAALGQRHGDSRTCRYCGYVASDEPGMLRVRLEELEQWEKEFAQDTR